MRWYNKERSNQMANIEYSNSPNVDTAFVVQEGGQKNRAVLTAPQDTSTLELPKNPNSTKGYVTVDGKKHKVVLTADIAGGGSGGGAVSSVNGKTGDVVLNAEDVNAIPQLTDLPTDSSAADWVGKKVLYMGDDHEEMGYVHGLMYECTSSSDGYETSYSWDICKVQSDFQNVPQFSSVRLDINEDFFRSTYGSAYDSMLFQYSGQSFDETPATGSANTTSQTITDVQLDVDTFVAYETPILQPVDPYEGFEAQYTFEYNNGWSLIRSRWFPLEEEETFNVPVDIADFGITYTGTPTNGDTIDVTIYPGIATYRYGYFYQVWADSATAKCTIAQTTGATLSDLAIDTDVLWADDIAMTRGVYNFEYLGGSNWQAPDESTIPQIALQDTYGITFTGTPSVGDVITVTTIVPWKLVYVYNQVNVQPTLNLPDTMPTLVAADWSSNTQTISVFGVTANNIVFVSPAPSSAAEYGQCGIICTAQATDSLTFTCTATPTNDLTVNVLILG